MRRSVVDPRDRRGFTLILMTIMMTLMMGAVWQVPIGVAMAMGDGLAGATPAWANAAAALGTFLSQCRVGPLITISLSLFYYDERVRKEAFDLDHLMSRLDETSDSSPATA